MEALRALSAAFPDAGKDIRTNLTTVLAESSLPPRTHWMVALASALSCRSPALRDAIEADGAAHLDDAAREDAQAAAALMAMNNVFYRFRHMVGRPGYAALPARLRMGRIGQPRTSKAEFELACLAVSAIHGCEACVRAHEQAVIEGGMNETNVLDAVRIASVVHAAAVTASMARVVPGRHDPHSPSTLPAR
jgi:alkyl hydroperoxide reductase subunit D